MTCPIRQTLFCTTCYWKQDGECSINLIAKQLKLIQSNLANTIPMPMDKFMECLKVMDKFLEFVKWTQSNQPTPDQLGKESRP
jgi:hypothetical protein